LNTNLFRHKTFLINLRVTLDLIQNKSFTMYCKRQVFPLPFQVVNLAVSLFFDDELSTINYPT
jgi:hypothetical protein